MITARRKKLKWEISLKKILTVKIGNTDDDTHFLGDFPVPVKKDLLLEWCSKVCSGITASTAEHAFGQKIQPRNFFLPPLWLLREKNKYKIFDSVLAKMQCYEDRTITLLKSDNFVIKYKSISPRN